VKRTLALGALLASGLALPRPARAQVGEPGFTPNSEEGMEAPPSEPAPSDNRPSHSVTRLSVVAGYRGLFDLQVAGAGVALSYGGAAPVSGHFNLRLMGGRTLGGLGIFELAPSGTVEFALGEGFRFGLGAGLSLFTISRATNGNLVGSCGPTGLARVAYDFAPHRAMFILTDFDAEWQAGAVVWGPTLAVGYRF
jgi:hypothetical protein